MILAIDPGTTESGWVVYDPIAPAVVKSGVSENPVVEVTIQNVTGRGHVAVCERIRGYGMPVGASVFETCEWTGRFHAACCCPQTRWHWLERRDVKLHLCGSSRAKDANVRQALIDKFPPTGGGKRPQIGTKKQPGPLYGVTSHAWAALAVAVTFVETRESAQAAAPNGRQVST